MARMRFDIYLYLVWFLQFIYCIVSYGTSAEDWQTKLLLLFNIYNLAIVIRVVRLGIKKGIKGFQTVLYGIFIAILGLLVLSTGFQFLNYGHSSTGLNELRLGVSTYLIDFIALIGGISIPVGLSLFMGIQSRETNLALSKQLNENEMLKNKAIEQEQEKQQILESQKEMLEIQVNERTAQLNQSLENLKATQNQLIQSEKLASLGELTAGIAHEIQNPLNFVNNFSELSNELIDEVLEERKKDEEERDESLENEILADLKQNLTKIHHHGKRASNIIRGMLQHSRKSSDVKELTDINALCDEYLRLSYHGLRAKDKSFNASFETHFDPSLPKTEVITQDIGRVILNLINNAFYAVNEKRKKGEPGYIPTVTVSTLLTDSKHFQIKIQDNGLGIPEHIKEKIFQPFFTTKPSGQGTGLGLSLAYDIITKGHGGTLEVNSTEGAGADFIIQIPI
ncbi:MAG: hypothetical protein K1X92_00420 [Bacteroidia bacterium]|nr:hypothetical protein [Bacteroidia bacterium]